MIPEEEIDLETGEEMGDYSDEEPVVVGQMTTVMVPRHIKKRSLKDKALSVSFDEKTLRFALLTLSISLYPLKNSE